VSNSTALGFLAGLVTDELVANGTLVMEYDLVSGGGASGAPVLNAKGEVIAMNFAGNTKDSDTEFGYGVIVKALRQALTTTRVWQTLNGN
jgi:V8-like Glu-specific endopeptidase